MSLQNSPTLKANAISCLRQHQRIFSDISFEVKAGEMLLVHGQNGSGKSSLLRMLAGIASPATGQIECDAPLHYISHQNGIKLGLTIEENLKLIHCNDTDAVLSSLQLSAHKKTLTKNLSAGQKRKVALARLFLIPKKLWILDEPFTALDAETQSLFLLKLNEHLNAGGMAVISSHHAIALENHRVHTLRLETC